MTHEDMVRWGEQLATSIVEKQLTDVERARLSVMLGCQLILMGQVFAEDEGIDPTALLRESLERGRRWHEGVLDAAPTGLPS